MLTDTLYRQPRRSAFSCCRSAARAARASSARAGCGSTPARRHLPARRRRDRPGPAAGTRDVCRRRPELAGQPLGRLHRARDRALSAAGCRADGRPPRRCSRPSSSRRRRRRAARPLLIGPADIQVNARGSANYSREVHDIFVTDPHVQRLMVGETFNPPGNWSSYPPHKHDGKDGEPTLEEVYYFTIYPPQGFGQQMLYTNDGGVGVTLGARRRRGAPAVRLSPGLGAAGLRLCYSGAWLANRKAGAARGSRAQVDPRSEALEAILRARSVRRQADSRGRLQAGRSGSEETAH